MSSAREHLTAQLDTVKGKSVAMQLRAGETDHKPLAIDQWRRQIGGAIERALKLANLTKQDVSYEMGYGSNQAPISNWISGKETPQFAKLFSVKALRGPLVVALAELSDDVQIETTIRVKRSA
jgi:hypothetical protein